jgi:hypothetical protein
MDNRPWMEAAHPRLSGLPGDTVNEGGNTHSFIH